MALIMLSPILIIGFVMVMALIWLFFSGDHPIQLFIASIVGLVVLLGGIFYLFFSSPISFDAFFSRLHP